MDNQEKSSLSQAASTAHAVHGAIKTGKAIAAAAKGAAAGGPYGAAAGLALESRRHLGKILAVVAVLILLPVLYVLMLPALIFGGLAGSGGSSGQPVLNDNTAIVRNVNDIAFAVNQILAEGITDAEARIAQDFAATGGDNYEVINPYATDTTGNVNSFIGQYCAFKGEAWEEVSLTDMQDVLHRNKSSLFSYSRIAEVRTVEDDDPETEDVAETRDETWYVYTLVYNGEDHFADAVFHLTAEQKTQANEYAQNLSVFLGDGVF